MSTSIDRHNDKDTTLLLLEIENFAADYSIEFDRIYDLETAEEIFLSELADIEKQAEACDDVIVKMVNVDDDFLWLWIDIEKLYAEHIPEFKEYDTYHAHVYNEITNPYLELMNKSKAHLLHQAWEIRTYLTACKQYKDMSGTRKSAYSTLADRMLGSAWGGTGSV